MSYDAARAVTILFGGEGSGGLRLGDTWQWDGAEWTEIGVFGPPSRWNHAMAFDAARSVTVLFGGEGIGGARLRDTWEWDGVEWTEVATMGPLPRWSHAMASDASRGVTVLFGGEGSGGARLRDTWEWVGGFTFVQHPRDEIAVRGESADFTVVVEGSGRWTYQWRLNGEPLRDAGPFSGSTTDTLTIHEVSRPLDGAYDCVVSTAICQMASKGARLFVVDPRLHVISSCPGGGAIAIRWRHVFPDGRVALLWAREQGHLRIPSGWPCAGTSLALSARSLLVVWQGPSGSEGSGSVHGNAPPGLCDGYLQLLDLSTCTTSNTAQVE